MAADIEPRQAELRGNADEDRWVFWSSQAALFGLMTLGMTTLGDYLLKPVTVARLDRKLAQWEEKLPAADFLRVSRSVILRLDRLEGIRWDWQQGTQLSFRGSTATLTIGRPATRRLKDRLQETHPQRSGNDDLKDPFPPTR